MAEEEQTFIQRFEGDEQIPEIWRTFLIHNGWIDHPDGKWEVAPKGKAWIERRSWINHIAETGADLAMYKVLIKIDSILEHYSETVVAAMDSELVKLLRALQTSTIMIKEVKL